ncbi:MAG: ABC transporter permease [Ideonella sp.]|nr:ABC transporter permease [Ideonella sp.]MCC7457741.1 ABC transporter permease [Nitrospira sp.]
MGFKFVFLWTDLALWALIAAVSLYGWRVWRQPSLRATWRVALRDAATVGAGAVLLLFLCVTALDSVHFRRALPPAPGQAAGTTFYETRTESLLDLVLARPLAMRESSYSRPLATHGLLKQNLERNGQSVRETPRLQFGGAHLRDPEADWAGDIALRVAGGLAVAALVAALLSLVIARVAAAPGQPLAAAWQAVMRGRTAVPWRALWLTLSLTALLVGPVIALMGHYHVCGTDRTGNDVLVQALKSVRTAFVIGTLSTLATVPLALGLGVLAGFLKGWVDEAVQYVYTVITSVPNVLLIAACVLMLQVFIDTHGELFDTGLERADLKMFLLCIILGLTGWATLCRLVRAETLKLRELEFVQAAEAFGVSARRTMLRHIVPNVMHLVLITTVLNFSDLILYEAVLTYVGVGVDPNLSSFGGMINLSRNEMSLDPLVWWSFATAFGFMVTLVLAANLFADGVRDAFDPRARAFRPRRATTPAAG